MMSLGASVLSSTTSAVAAYVFLMLSLLLLIASFVEWNKNSIGLKKWKRAAVIFYSFTATAGLAWFALNIGGHYQVFDLVGLLILTLFTGASCMMYTAYLLENPAEIE